jgi:hypothetical protein
MAAFLGVAIMLPFDLNLAELTPIVAVTIVALGLLTWFSIQVLKTSAAIASKLTEAVNGLTTQLKLDTQQRHSDYTLLVEFLKADSADRKNRDEVILKKLDILIEGKGVKYGNGR